MTSSTQPWLGTCSPSTISGQLKYFPWPTKLAWNRSRAARPGLPCATCRIAGLVACGEEQARDGLRCRAERKCGCWLRRSRGHTLAGEEGGAAQHQSDMSTNALRTSIPSAASWSMFGDSSQGNRALSPCSRCTTPSASRADRPCRRTRNSDAPRQTRPSQGTAERRNKGGSTSETLRGSGRDGDGK